jgi:selenocysteine lyase/cysteine desulfurase
MDTNRRNFVRSISALAASIPLAGLINPAHAAAFKYKIAEVEGLDALQLATDEDFWYYIRNSYTVSPNIINLNNGGVSPQPKIVQDTFENYNRMSNEAPSYYMWRILDKGREGLRQKMADMAGCLPDELAFNRNATEALDTVIFGLPLKMGDEVVLTKQDYPNMIHAWKLREKRDGIKLVWLDLKLPIEDDTTAVSQFEDAVTAKTRVIHITHIINWIGQILPAAKIAAACRKKNANLEVLIDGAHSFAHLDYKIPELGGDYFGTSLHKWLSAPFGNGLLWVKEDKIAGLFPLFPNDKPESEDIRKFETLGTRSFPTEQAAGVALNFHNGIGGKRKEERLRYLKNYWASKVKDIKGVKIHTSLKPEYSCALALFSVDGKKPVEVESFLFENHKIHTVGIEWELGSISGVRVTPHVYTSLTDLDRLVEAIDKCAKK